MALILSCKHEIPGSDTGLNPGPGPAPQPVPVQTCNPDTAYFQQQVLPIFISNCSMSGCHDAASAQHGVVLTSYNSIITTGDVEPGNPNHSEIYEKITESDNDDRMPPAPRPRLTQAQIATIRKWIQQGAKNNSCTSSSCDTGNVTYSGTIRTIIGNKCQGCHSGNAAPLGYDFTSYNGVKARINDGKLWGAVNHVPGYSPMPKNGTKLSDCELLSIKKWIDSGAPNN
jgi:mono/diheme cytochrome c family protein